MQFELLSIRSLSVVCFAVLWCLLIAGCGGGEDYEVVPVSGKVTLDGRPVPKLRITFQPQATEEHANPGPGSYGITDKKGRFELAIAEPKGPGAVVGTHTVRMTGCDPRKYALPWSCRDGTLTFDVPPEGTEEANFEFNSRRR